MGMSRRGHNCFLAELHFRYNDISHMKAVVVGAAAVPCSLRVRCGPVPFTASRVAPVMRQIQRNRADVRVAFFKFGKNGFGAEDAGIVGSQGRDDYCYDDVEAYFNYMGCLADEGNYDRLEKLNVGRHPIDVILLLAAEENDTPKIQEILKAGADVNVKGLDGRTPLDYATKPETRALIGEYVKKVAA